MSPQSVVRICCIRSFGHFVARLQGSILQFNPEVGIFVSIAQSEQESLLQQAQAQFRMVRNQSERLGCTGGPGFQDVGRRRLWTSWGRSGGEEGWAATK